MAKLGGRSKGTQLRPMDGWEGRGGASAATFMHDYSPFTRSPLLTQVDVIHPQQNCTYLETLMEPFRTMMGDEMSGPPAPLGLVHNVHTTYNKTPFHSTRRLDSGVAVFFSSLASSTWMVNRSHLDLCMHYTSHIIHPTY